MTKLIWGSAGKRFYEAGTDRGVLYLDGTGVAWDGLISVDESPSGGESEKYYYDGVPYISSSSMEEFKASLEAYTWPVEFSQCDGSEEIAQGLYISQQSRKEFGLSYRTLIGNDLDELEHGYKIHILYHAMAEPSSRTYSTMGDDTDPTTFKWNISTRPIKFEDPAFGIRYGAHLVLDSREVYPWAMAAVEEVLYGTDTTAPRLPTPRELLDLFIDNALLKITDNGDGTWSAEGPDSIIQMLGDDMFTIDWPSVIPLDEDTVQISSL
ncbi:major tail protein [Arthrobacter phage Caterpillar]|nr:major tail protein [Arthrobacter phage Caterpillar]